MTVRVHLFPSRTQKLSSRVPKILGWRRPGKIGRRLHRKETSLCLSLFCFLAKRCDAQYRFVYKWELLLEDIGVLCRSGKSQMDRRWAGAVVL